MIKKKEVFQEKKENKTKKHFKMRKKERKILV